MTFLEKELVAALEKVVACLNGDAPAFDLRKDEGSFRTLLARAKQTGTHEFTVSDDGHGQAMVGGKALSYGGCRCSIGSNNIDPEHPHFVEVGTRVRVELRDGCDFATLVEVLHGA